MSELVENTCDSWNVIMYQNNYMDCLYMRACIVIEN